MDDLCVLPATWENHFKYLESMYFVCVLALQSAGLTLKPSKLALGPNPVVYLGHEISVEGVSVSEDRIKAIQDSTAVSGYSIASADEDICFRVWSV